MVATIVHQLTRCLTPEEIEKSGFAPYYTDHTVGIWPQAAGGVPFNANQFQSSGDPITDLFEDLAAEQKARKTYDNLLRLIKDPDVADPIRFLRAREIVHFQRFGEAMRTYAKDFGQTLELEKSPKKEGYLYRLNLLNIPKNLHFSFSDFNVVYQNIHNTLFIDQFQFIPLISEPCDLIRPGHIIL